jgi:hypothetical protein
MVVVGLNTINLTPLALKDLFPQWVQLHLIQLSPFKDPPSMPIDDLLLMNINS